MSTPTPSGLCPARPGRAARPCCRSWQRAEEWGRSATLVPAPSCRYLRTEGPLPQRGPGPPGGASRAAGMCGPGPSQVPCCARADRSRGRETLHATDFVPLQALSPPHTHTPRSLPALGKDERPWGHSWLDVRSLPPLSHTQSPGGRGKASQCFSPAIPVSKPLGRGPGILVGRQHPLLAS